ncbi:hypothetical protein BH11PSE11_BH11PSE11_22590 [soil metagenome]
MTPISHDFRIGRFSDVLRRFAGLRWLIACVSLGVLWLSVLYQISVIQQAANAVPDQIAIYLWSGVGGSIAILVFMAFLAVHGERDARVRTQIDQALRAAIAASPSAFCILQSVKDPEGRIADFIFIDLNDSAAELFGGAKRRAAGAKLSSVLPHGHEALFERYRLAALAGTPQEEEFELGASDGQPRWLQHQILPAGDDRIAVSTVDISLRKYRELELLTQQAQLLAVSDASPLGLFRTGPDGACTYVNRAYEKMSGLSKELALGDGWAQSIHPEDRLKVFQGWGKSSKANQPYQAVYRFRHRDGRIVWASMKTASILVEGRILGYVGTVDDITARHEAEQALLKSEQRLRTITDALPALVAYVDADELFRFNNLAYERAFGVGRGEILDKTLREFLGEAEYELIRPYVRRVLNGESVSFEKDENREGRYRCAESSYIPQFAMDGEHVIGFHVMVQDITNKKIEERRLLQLAQSDSLTDLLNRAGFEHKLGEAMARSGVHGALMAVMYLDVDHFKAINDKLGHQVGDLLLKAFAARLSRSLRAGDVVARLGGDEFVVIMENLDRTEDAEKVAAKIVQSMRTLFSLEGHPVSATASIGVAFYRGGPADAKTLVRQADDMLYRAKAGGRNRYMLAQFLESEQPEKY